MTIRSVIEGIDDKELKEERDGPPQMKDEETNERVIKSPKGLGYVALSTGKVPGYMTRDTLVIKVHFKDSIQEELMIDPIWKADEAAKKMIADMEKVLTDYIKDLERKKE